MNNFNDLYNQINNKTLVVFDDFFNIQFYVNYKGDLLQISEKPKKNFDYMNVKCRHLTKQNWNYIYEQQDELTKIKLILSFSVVSCNFLDLELNQNCLSLQSLNLLLKLHPKIINYISDKIYDKIKCSISEQYRSKITLQFRRLYNSDKGIVLKYKEIGQYLNLCAFYEKLGLNYFDLQKLPYSVYLQLLMMINVENQIKNQQIRQLNNKNSKRR